MGGSPTLLLRAEIVTSEVTRAHETGNHGTIYSSPVGLLAVFLSIALIQSTLAREWPHILHTFGDCLLLRGHVELPCRDFGFFQLFGVLRMVHSRDFSPSALCPVKAGQDSKEWLPALPLPCRNSQTWYVVWKRMESLTTGSLGLLGTSTFRP